MENGAVSRDRHIRRFLLLQFFLMNLLILPWLGAISWHIRERSEVAAANVQLGIVGSDLGTFWHGAVVFLVLANLCLLYSAQTLVALCREERSSPATRLWIVILALIILASLVTGAMIFRMEKNAAAIAPFLPHAHALLHSALYEENCSSPPLPFELPADWEQQCAMLRQVVQSFPENYHPTLSLSTQGSDSALVTPIPGERSLWLKFDPSTKPPRLKGVFFQVEGSAPTPIQFYPHATDIWW